MSITRRDFLKLSAGAVAASAVPGARTWGATTRPNLLFVITDQLPVSCVGAYGNTRIRTPNIDRLSREGVTLGNFHIGGFPCSPSRATYFSGLYPHQHHVLENDILFDASLPSLGELFHNAGYETNYIGKWHLGGNMYRGIRRKGESDDWYRVTEEGADGFTFAKKEGGGGEDKPAAGFTSHWIGGWEDYHRYLRGNGLGDLLAKNPSIGNHNDFPSGPDSTHAYSRIPAEHHVAAFLSKQAERLIRQRQPGAPPFATVLSFYGPHLPVAPPQPWDEMYSLDEVTLPPNHRDGLKGKPYGQRTNSRCYVLDTWTDEQFKDYIRRYWGYVSFIDQQLGRVLKALDDIGAARDTVVVFCADHGDMVGGHGMIYKLTTCGYDELMRVPFIVRYPAALQAGRRVNALASAVDVLPTFLDLGGIAKPDRVYGRSFRALFDGKADHYTDMVVCDSMNRSLVVRTADWKYVCNWNPRDLDELYDERADPGELHNLAQDSGSAAALAEMQQRLVSWLGATRHPYAAKITAAMHSVPEKSLFVEVPRILEWKYLGDRTISYTYEWECRDSLASLEKFWSFTQFIRGRNNIVFRTTVWPDPPTTAWRVGFKYRIGPLRVKIPETAPVGVYEVRIGLFSPEKKAGPRYLGPHSGGNYVVVGTMEIRGGGGNITDAIFTPRK